MSDWDIPTSVMSSTLTISGVPLRVHVLDNGQRIIKAEDVHALFEAWASGPLIEGDALELARALRVMRLSDTEPA